MPAAVVVSRRVEFSDTDMAGIVHFASFFRYMEAAEHEFVRQLGFTVHDLVGDETISWPRVSASCDYASPARFGDELQIEVSIEKLGSRSVSYRFVFRRGETRLAEGKMTSVCCRIVPGQPPKSIPIPPDVRKMLQAATAN